MKFGTYLGRLRRLTEPDFYTEKARYAKNSCLQKARDFKSFWLEGGRDLKNWTCWKFSYEPHSSLAAYLEECGIGGFFGYALDNPKLAPLVAPFVVPAVKMASYPFISLFNGMSRHLYELDSTVGFCILAGTTAYGLAELDIRVRRWGKKFNRSSERFESVQLEPSPDAIKENSEEKLHLSRIN